MQQERAETIFALSSGAPPAAIAIIRVSGARAGAVLAALAGRLPTPRYATLVTLRDAAGTPLDRALLLWFPGPDTATGEDLAELHVHGGRAVVRAVLGAIGALPGCRMAQPGEFTRRALLNGKLDLTAAEGLADLLEAESEQARVAALRMAEGGLRRKVHGWRAHLLGLTAEVEAALEFGEELEDEDLLPAAFGKSLGQLIGEVDAALRTAPAERLRDGFRVVIAGPPNSGKSTLINVLADRDVAIATPIAGTTRDSLEAPVLLGGVAVLLTDTAGLRETNDMVEAIGVDRAQAAIAAADLILWMGSVEDAPDRAILIHALSDLAGREALPPGYDIAISAKTGAGMDDLRQRIVDAADAHIGEDDLALNRRQRDLLRGVRDTLEAARAETDAILCAERLRWACAAFDAVVGGTDVEVVLDGIFSRFCLGK